MNKVLVIGAAGGIGLEVTRQLCAKGEHVAGTVMDGTQAGQLREAVPDIAKVEVLLLDNAEAVVPQVEAIVDAMGGVDQVVVCAAVGPLGPCELTPISDYAAAMNINFMANVAVFQAVLPALRASRGRLVLISSMGGKVSLPFVGAYSASKHALEGFADAARQEIAGDGVDLVLIEPGGVRTGMVSGQIAWTNEALGKLDAEQAARYGAFYSGFVAAAQAGYDGAGSTPQQVAEVIVGALAADQPETRYVVGPDAEQLIGAKAALGDRDMDATLAAFFAGAS